MQRWGDVLAVVLGVIGLMVGLVGPCNVGGLDLLLMQRCLCDTTTVPTFRYSRQGVSLGRGVMTLQMCENTGAHNIVHRLFCSGSYFKGSLLVIQAE